MKYKKGSEIKIDNYIFVWLSIIEDINYVLVLRLLKAFNLLENLYNTSNNKYLFRSILVQNNIKLSNKIFSSLTSLDVKEKAKEIYNNLLNQNINFINIFSNDYPYELKSVINAPILICYFGNINLLRKKKVYIYKSSDINENKYSKICSKLFSLNNVICINKEKDTGTITFLDVDLFNKDFLFSSNFSPCNLYILSPINSSCKCELLASLTDYLLILNASYNKIIYRLTYNMLDFGKEILVVPGDIQDKNCYFSNYLLKEGASVVLNEEDIQDIFKS